MCVFHFLLKMLLKWKPIFFLWTELIIRNLNYNSHRNSSYNVDILHLIRFCTRGIFLYIYWAFNSSSTEGNWNFRLWTVPCSTALAQLWQPMEHQGQLLKTAWLENCHFNFSGFHFILFFNSAAALSMV